MHPEALYAHGLNSVVECNPKRLANLHAYFGSYKTAWHASASDLSRALEHAELGALLHQARTGIDLETEQRELEKLKITLITKESPAYPKQLEDVPLPPALLYVEGTLVPTVEKTSIAVVGTRMTTSYGREACRILVEQLAKAGIPIISGLAVGIDTEAHKTTLAAGGYTAAVLGSGTDRNSLYPSSNRRLADEIIARGGALISEYPPYSKANTWTFPLRNRIIAGLASAVLVVEAREKSGTLITARHAMELGRDVLAVPGSIFSATSKTPHALIRDGAVPVTSPEDIFHALGIERNPVSVNTCAVLPEEQEILDILEESQTANDVARMLKKSISDIQRILALLEIHGMVRNMGNGVYRKI